MRPDQASLKAQHVGGLLQLCRSYDQLLDVTGVARAIRVVDTRQKARASSNLYTGESSDSIRVSATGTSQPDTPGSPSPRLATQEDDFQVLTAHDNGQVQVWGAGSGWLQPVFRIGQAGPAAR